MNTPGLVRKPFIGAVVIAFLFTVFVAARAGLEFWDRRHAFQPIAVRPPLPATPHLSAFQQKVVTELRRETEAGVRYQDGYFDGGNPPANIGVCSDVVVRGFLAAGVDLQKALAVDVTTAP